jgi:hypothetical protein
MKKKVKSLSKEQMEFIDENWQTHTHEQLAINLSVSMNVIGYYCSQNSYRKTNAMRVAVKKKKYYKNKGPESEPINRPPADHTNVSREQHIDRWLNMAI